MITVIFGSENDGHLTSNSSFYSSALDGSNLTVFNSGTGIRVGQVFDGSTYYVRQGFLEFVYGSPDNSETVAGQFVLQGTSVRGTGESRNLEIFDYDWGSDIDSGDFRDPDQIEALGDPGRAFLRRSQYGVNRRLFLRFQRREDLDSDGTLRYVVITHRNRHEHTPDSWEDQTFYSARGGGTSNDPKLEVYSVPNHLLNKTLGAQVQISDGTHIYVEQESASGSTWSINLCHRDHNDNVTVIESLNEPSMPLRGAQSYGLVRDGSDNLFLFRSHSSNTDFIYARPYVKGSGNSWTRERGTSIHIVGDYPGFYLVSLAGTYHDVGSGGTIFLFGMKEGGEIGGNTDPWLLINAEALLNRSNEHILKATGRGGDNFLVAHPSHVGYFSPLNPTGTLLDVSGFSHTRRGFIVTSERNQLIGANGPQSIGRYHLNADGTGFDYIDSFIDTNGGFSTKDPEAKSRIFNVEGSESEFVTINASSETAEGITVRHRYISGNSSFFCVLSTINLDKENISTMPQAETVATSSAWDAVYNSVDSSVWVYYFDRNDPRRLMRTQIDLDEGLAVANEVEVATGVGEVNSTNFAIRVHRGNQNLNNNLITVSNKTAITSGGDHSLIYINDVININPTQPPISSKDNFDATTQQTFEWEFIDPDPNDSQTAYRLEIDNSTTGASAYDSGKVSSSSESHDLPADSINNDEDYRWRVRVWDSEDAVSPWSDYGTFTTSSTGVVDIIDPTVDNESGIHVANYEIEWTVDNSTQDHYMVVVSRTDNGNTLIDTGWVESTDTTYEIQGLESGIEYLIEVTTRSSGVESNTATRLITSNYNAPEVPIVSYSINNTDGYIRVSVENPTPQGDRPNPDLNDIYRRVSESGNAYELVGSINPNSSFRDYTVSGGVMYEYRVRAGVR